MINVLDFFLNILKKIKLGILLARKYIIFNKKIRMKTKTIIVSMITAATVATTANSCVALATSSIGMAIIKQVLLGGITKGLTTFKDKDAFLKSPLINEAMPASLKEINSLLNKVSPSLVDKEKDYIASAASYIANTSEPILTNAVHNLTQDDIAKIAQGGKGAATMVLKEKTSSQLVAAIAPKVDQKLNEFGIVNTINTALKGSSLLNGLLGNQNTNNLATAGFSQLVTEQLVNGLFNIIQNHEEQNTNQISKALGK